MEMHDVVGVKTQNDCSATGPKSEASMTTLQLGQPSSQGVNASESDVGPSSQDGLYTNGEIPDLHIVLPIQEESQTLYEDSQELEQTTIDAGDSNKNDSSDIPSVAQALATKYSVTSEVSNLPDMLDAVASQKQIDEAKASKSLEQGIQTEAHTSTKDLVTLANAIAADKVANGEPSRDTQVSKKPRHE